MYGIERDTSENRCSLIEPIGQSDLDSGKVFHLEIETNPLNTNAAYRLLAKCQSLKVTYRAVRFLYENLLINHLNLIR